MEEWIGLLVEIEAAIDRLIETSGQKREALVAGNVEAVEALVREETGLLARVANLEEKRQRSVVVYALRNRIDTKGITLYSVLETLPEGEGKDTISQLRLRLIEKMEELERLNGVNKELLTTQRDIAQFLLEGMTTPVQLGTQYSGSGRDAELTGRISLIDKNA